MKFLSAPTTAAAVVGCLAGTALAASPANLRAAHTAAMAKAGSAKRQLSVTYDAAADKYKVQEGVIATDADAFGHYYTEFNSSGWGFLDAHMQGKVSSSEQHLALGTSLGYLEGYITCDTVKTFYPNFASAVFGSSGPNDETVKFIEDNYKWLAEQAASNDLANDQYWHTVRFALNQIEGVARGVKEGCPSSTPAPAEPDYSSLEHPTLTHLLLMNAWGDLYQITAKYLFEGVGRGMPKWRAHQHTEAVKQMMQKDEQQLTEQKHRSSVFVDRCSAIVKVLPGYSDIVYGHATWDTFESLAPRMLKHISQPMFNNGKVETMYDIYFSSSPGLLSSVDDFFTSSGYANFGVIETTNDLLNVKLLDLVKPESVLSYLRALLANQLAKDSPDWARLFSKYQSGTYTNQWMVMDLSKFEANSKPQDGFFVVVEEVPGYVRWEDMTSTLINQTYWPSYNTPYFDDINELSGYARACKFNDEWCYDTAPRAKMFRDRHSAIVDASGAEKILAYNDFQHDPYSKGDSCNAIACRADLEPEASDRSPFGALDAKVSTVLASKRAPGELPIITARMGPTTDQQKPFCWSDVRNSGDYSHNGHPDCFDFPWTTMLPDAAL